MPRPERAVEGNGPLADFARQLREARSRAGVTYRELAAASGFSPSALASAASGSSLPTWKVAEAYLSACGIVQPELGEWRARWERARDSRAAPDTGSPADDGLTAPRPDDHELLTKPARVRTQNDFGHELTALRVRAGLTVRKVARAAGMPVSTVGDYFAGRHLPADDQQLRKLLEACGETGRDQITQWTDALHRTRRSGGIRSALARAAEETYDSLDDGQRRLAQWLFLHFVCITDDTPSTRAMDPAKLRRRRRLRDNHPATDVLAAFVDARLVTVDAQNARITHDTLIHTWPRLRGWVDDNASLLRVLGQLDQSSSAWADDGRDSAHLYRGSQLTAALETLKDQKDLLTPVNREFLGASKRLKRRQQCKRQATCVKNILSPSVVPVIFVVFVVFVVWRANAVTHKRDTALREDAALSKHLAYASRTISDPAAAALMAANAWRIAPTGQAGNSLVTASTRQAVTSLRLPVGRGEAIDPAVAFSPDGTTLATSTHNSTIQLWNTATRHLTTTLHTGNNTPAAITFSPDGTTLATSTHNSTIQLWNTATRHPIPLPLARHTGVVYAMAFSPDSRTLATGYDKGSIQLWNTVTRKSIGSLQSGDAAPVLSMAFSPDGMTLAASNSQKMVRVWDLATGRLEGSFQTGIRRESPFLPDTGFTEIDYSPAGGLLVSVGADGTVQLWNETTLHEIGTPMTTDGISDAVFSPDGRILATVEGGEHPVVYLWTLPTTTSANQLSDVICARAEHVLVGTGVTHPSPCPT